MIKEIFKGLTMKKIISFLLIIVLSLSALSGCGGNKTTYPETVDAHLIEGEDYIDHTNSYVGNSMTYNDSMWYVNKLQDVPLPDPYVYVEGDTYYIVGTSDRDGNVIKCLDCNSLKSIKIGENSFTLSSSFRIIDNEQLVTIDIGENTFDGERIDDSLFELSGIL